MVDAGRPDHHAIPHHHPPVPRRQIVAQVIVGAVILVSGIAIGGGGTILALKDRILPPIDDSGKRSTPGPDVNELRGRADWIAKRWTEDYGLSEEQGQQARDTLAKEFLATDRLRQDFRKAEEDQRSKFIQTVKGILTPEQFARWEPDFRRMVEHMQRMRPFDPDRGGRGGPRPEWRPDRPRDPNDHRGDRPPGAPKDPNGPRGDWRFGRRGDWPRERSRDPNDQRGPRPPDRPPEPNAGPGLPPEPK